VNPQHLTVAIEAARAGAAALVARRDSHTVHEKAPKDLVTDADLASQAVIRSKLGSAFPEYAFVGEEEGENEPTAAIRRGDPSAPPCWVVDPLDGTVNYVHRLQSFAVSIGLYAAGKMKLGVVLDPVTDELFTAIDGAGAHCNGAPIRASGTTDIAHALVACSFRAGVRRDDPEVTRFGRVLEKCRSVRRLGSCALNMCYVAAGRLDAYWATSVNPWDTAAGTVIAREAGVEITRDNGSPLDDWDPRMCLTASAELHGTMLNLLNSR